MYGTAKCNIIIKLEHSPNEHIFYLVNVHPSVTHKCAEQTLSLRYHLGELFETTTERAQKSYLLHGYRSLGIYELEVKGITSFLVPPLPLNRDLV